MKGRIILTLGVLFILPNLFSQVEYEPDYKKFKSYFTHVEVDSKERQDKIPIDLAAKILGKEIVNENVVYIYPLESIKYKKNEIFIIEVTRPQGGYTSTYFMLSFINKTLSKSEPIGYNALNMDGGISCELMMVNDTVLEVKKQEVEYNEEGEVKKIYDTEYTYFVVCDAGFYDFEMDEVTNGRLYPQASKRILKISELNEINKEDLDIIRNEIFADHGYIFKTAKWENYFDLQNWYNPRFDDVTDKLTIIEKINIENVLKVAMLK
jgi:hypothetical protein